MTTLTNSLDQNFEFKNNLVVLIDGTYFGKYQPDSGLVIDADKLLVNSATINPTQIDLRRATTQINSTTVNILNGTVEDGPTFASFVGQDDNALIGKEIRLFFGRVNEGIPFSEYLEISKYIISDVSLSNNFYKIRAKSQEDKALEPAFDQQGTLDSSINDVVASVDVNTETDIFPSTGIIKVGSEYMLYSGTSFSSEITTFTISARGYISSTAASHTAGAQVNYVQELNGNPIDLIVQLLVSSGGGGSYDVLADGAGIDNTLVDVAAFEAIRDEYFSSDVFTLYFSDADKLLVDIERELLVPNNVRIIKNSMDNLISIAILDQSDFSIDAGEIDDSMTLINTPKWKISKNGLQTVVKVQWNWIEGLQKYTRSKTFKAPQDILDIYGEIKGVGLKFKGVQTADNGDNIAADRANRYLSRFSTPRATIKLSSFSTAFSYNIGDKIRVTAKHLPQAGGSLGFGSVVELVNRSFNSATGVLKFGFRFTSYTNLRQGLISPSPFLDLAIDSQFTFEVPDGSCYKVGYVLKLWDYASNAYHTDPVNTVHSINGNFITMTNAWTTPLTSNEVLFFADYDEVDADQKSRYAFIVNDTDFFTDGSKGYEIIL